MRQEKLALFDFDDTLCRGDSIVPYLVYCIRHGLAPAGQLWKAIRAYFIQRNHPELAAGSKSTTLSFIRGRTPEEMDEVARGFFREVLAPRFFAQGQAELVRLHQEGYRIVIISASADVYMRVLPEFMPVDAVISTTCALDTEGRYTGEVCANCKGDEKPVRLASWLAAQGMTMDAAASRAYGDSPSDTPMLRLVGHPTRVGNKAGLAALLPGADQAMWR